MNDTTSTKRPQSLALISSLGTIIIMGAAGRDFSNFVYFRRNDAYRVVAFTATQIPGIEERICDSVVLGTPMNLDKLLKLDRPTIRARYELQEIGARAGAVT